MEDLDWASRPRVDRDQGEAAPIRAQAAKLDIWRASLGQNVGSEVNGKSHQFSRPVIIFKKLAHGFYFVVPTTTQPKTGSWFVQFKQKDRTMYASLHQARAIDYRHLYPKLGSLDETDQSRVREAFRRLYS